MFSLNQAIADWRRQITARGITSAEALDELEDHLREEVDQQMRAGLAAEQAFEVAARKVGPPKALQAEFTKAGDSNEERERKAKLAWLGVGALGYAAPIVLNGRHLLSQLHLTERWLATAAFALTMLSLFGGLVFYRFLPVISDKQTRTKFQLAMFLPLFIWVCVFAFVVLPRVDFTVGRLTVTTFWALLCPLAMSSGMAFGLDEAARRRTSPT